MTLCKGFFSIKTDFKNIEKSCQWLLYFLYKMQIIRLYMGDFDVDLSAYFAAWWHRGSFDVAGSAATPDHWRNALPSHELSPDKFFGQWKMSALILPLLYITGI